MIIIELVRKIICGFIRIRHIVNFSAVFELYKFAHSVTEVHRQSCEIRKVIHLHRNLGYVCLPFNLSLSFLCWGRAVGYQPCPQAADRGTTFRYEGKLRTKQVLHLTNKQSRTSSGRDTRTWRWLAGGDAYHHEIPTSSMTSL